MLQQLLCAALLATSALAAPQQQDPCTLTGRLTLPDGSPAVGATVNAHGWGANSERIQQFGEPANWKDPAPVTTDETGRYTLSFVAPRAYQFVLDANLNDYPEIGWRWSQLESGKTKDLGTVGFEAPCFIVGHIENQDGEILVDGWRVMGSSQDRPGKDRSPSYLHATPDPATGEFRIGPFPKGKVRLSTRSAIKARTKSLDVQVSPDQPTPVVLHYEGPSTERRIVFSTFSNPYYVFDLEGMRYPGMPQKDSNLVLLDSAGEVLQHAKHVQGTSQDWEFTDVDPGEYKVELRDPRFLPQTIEAVQPGQGYQIMLKGSASLKLTVTDEQGAELDRYGLWVGYNNVGFSPNEFEVMANGSAAPVDGVIRGVVPGDLLVEVRGPDGSKTRHTVGPVAAGETKEVLVSFKQGGSLRGTVQGPNGEAAAGIDVEYTRGEYAGMNSGGHASIGTQDGVIHIGGIAGSVQTDAKGQFEIPRLEPGKWTLRALRVPTAWTIQTVDFAPDTQSIQLTLPQTATLKGVLKGPAGFDLSSISVGAEPKNLSQVESVLYRPGRAGPAVDAEGQFRVEGMPVGEVTLTISQETSTGPNSSFRRMIMVHHVQLEEGAAPIEVDIAKHLPGSLNVTLLVDSAPMPGAYVMLVPTDREPPTSGRRGSLHGNNATTGKDGQGTIEGVKPGAYRMFTLKPERGLIFESSNAVTVKPQESQDIVLSFDSVTRPIQVLAADGKPLANGEVGISIDGMTHRDLRIPTDDQGRATLSLCPGTYGLFDTTVKELPDAPFSWSSGDDPLTIQLVQ